LFWFRQSHSFLRDLGIPQTCVNKWFNFSMILVGSFIKQLETTLIRKTKPSVTGIWK
jgi:hypothetical membrane protein